MSYILDALRKSERERKLSQPVSLDTMVFSPEPVRKRPWLLWALGAIAVINVAALGYFLGLQSGPPPTQRAAATQPTPAPVPATAPKKAPAVAAPSQPAAPVTPFARRFGGRDIPQGGPPQTIPAPVPAKPATPVAPALPAAPPRPAEHKAAPPPAADEDELEAEAETLTGESDATEETEDEDTAEPGKPARGVPPPAAAKPPRNTVPLLSEMPPAFQSRVPQIKINLFAYGPTPEERFVVINMNRQSIGATVADGVRLEGIDEDSLTLSFEGQRFRIERP